MTSPIDFEMREGVAIITLNRPQTHNALEFSDLDRLNHLIGTINDDPSVRVLVLTGSGTRTFCSGASLSEMMAQTHEGDEAWDTHPMEAMTRALENLNQPSICALNGSVYGGGVELALACDFRIGKPGIRSFVPPARVGIHYPPNGLRLLQTRLGLQAAKRLILAGETFDEATLRETGFCDWWAEDPLAAALERAQEIAGFAPLAVQGMKRSLNELARGALDEDRAYRETAACWSSEDLKEGLKARAEKRAPQFKGH